MRVNIDGSPYTLSRPNAFKDTLPYIICGGVFLACLMSATDIFQSVKNYYSSCLMWFFFMICAFLMISKILDIIRNDIKILPKWDKKVWTHEIIWAYVLLFVLAFLVSYLAYVLHISSFISLVLDLIKKAAMG